MDHSVRGVFELRVLEIEKIKIKTASVKDNEQRKFVFRECIFNTTLNNGSYHCPYGNETPFLVPKERGCSLSYLFGAVNEYLQSKPSIATMVQRHQMLLSNNSGIFYGNRQASTHEFCTQKICGCFSGSVQ
jgi:hypothetical protein